MTFDSLGHGLYISCEDEAVLAAPNYLPMVGISSRADVDKVVYNPLWKPLNHCTRIICAVKEKHAQRKKPARRNRDQVGVR